MGNTLEVNVRTAFVRASEGAESPEGLLTAVRLLVGDLKRKGQPPERVIVTIKRLCNLRMNTLLANTDASGESSKSRRISQMVIPTVIDEYYAESSLAGRR